MIDKTIKVQLGVNSLPVIVACTEGDTMWRWHFEVYYESQRWTIPSDGYVLFTGKKADGNVFDMLETIENNEAVVLCDEQMTAAIGPACCVLRFLDAAGKTVASTPVVLDVRPNPQTQGPMSETVLSAYNDVLELIGEAIGGVSNYNALENLPSVNFVTLRGNKTAAQLGLAPEDIIAVQTETPSNDTQLWINPDGTQSVMIPTWAEHEALAEDVTSLTKRGSSITPIYVGDFLTPTTRLPSCCIRIGNFFYCVEAPTRDAAIAASSNAGMIRKFDVTNNVEVVSAAQTAPVGHANSIAYDNANGRVYIAPVWDASTGTEVNALFLYVYDSSMTFVGTVATPSQAMAVSYDPVAGKLYYYDYSHRVYLRNGDAWELFTTIDFTGVVENEIYNRSYNQDFAVYDGKFYISSPYGNVIYGDLTEINAKVDGANIVVAFDSAARWHLGELEGFEFTEDGHLYAVNIVGLSTEVREGFVVELPVGTAIAHSTNLGGNVFRLIDGTLTLSEATQTKFALNTYELRSLNQLGCMTLGGRSSRVSIPEGSSVVDDYIIIVTQNFELALAGSYTIKRFNILGGELSVSAENESAHLLTATDSTFVFNCQRAGKLKITGQYVLRVATPNLPDQANNFVNIGYSYPVTLIRRVPISTSGNTFYIGSRELVNYGLYYGQTLVHRYQYGEEIVYRNPAEFTGYITSSSKQIRISIPLAKLVPADGCGAAITQGKVQIRGISGYLNGSSTAAVIDLTDTSTYGVAAYPRGSYLTILITSDTAFTNITNNTPIVAEVVDSSSAYLIFSFTQ